MLTVLAAVVVSAVDAGPPLELEIVATEAHTKTSVSVVHPDGGAAWTGTFVGDGKARALCVPGGALRVTRVEYDGGVETQTRDLRTRTGDVLACEATIGARGGLFISIDRVRAPLAGLKVEVVEADDATGHALFRITNDTDLRIAVEDASLDFEPVTFGPNFCWLALIRLIPPRSKLEFRTAEVFCPHALQPGVHHRGLKLGTAEWPGHDRFEFNFEFTAKPVTRLVLFPDVDFLSLRSRDESDGSMVLVAPTGSSCVCAGMHVGSRPHVLMKTRTGLCGQPIDAGDDECEHALQLAPQVGDFPDLPPYYNRPGYQP